MDLHVIYLPLYVVGARLGVDDSDPGICDVQCCDADDEMYKERQAQAYSRGKAVHLHVRTVSAVGGVVLMN